MHTLQTILKRSGIDKHVTNANGRKKWGRLTNTKNTLPPCQLQYFPPIFLQKSKDG